MSEPPVMSVLDQSPVASGTTPGEALRQTVELATALDGSVYRRFWVAEHHRSAAFAGPAPEILVADLLRQTTRLRIGSGGVLLPRHDPAKVAENFHVLFQLHGDRVDLGVGRAGGPADRFPDQVDLLTRSLRDLGSAPEVWLLGAGTGSSSVAFARGLRFCYGHFLNPAGAARVPGMDALAVRVFVADTAAAAEQQAAGFVWWRSRRDLGIDEPLPDPDRVAAHRWSDAELTRAAANRAGVLAGPPEVVLQQLTALAERYGAEELILNTLAHDPKDRLRAYQLLAEATGT